jgi:hypothetical protein
LAADEGADEAFEHGDRSRWMRLFLYGIGFGGGFGRGSHLDLGGDAENLRILVLLLLNLLIEVLFSTIPKNVFLRFP